MAKITKKAEILEHLNKLITKEAEMAQTNISGKPGEDTEISSVSDETESTDKSNVGPEGLNDKQKHEQKDSTDKSEPAAAAKTASNIDKLANEILNTISNKLAENAQTNISGTPLADTKATAVSESTESTNKNEVGPEKLNGKQQYDQKPSSDDCAPAKQAEELAVKLASYEMGRNYCDQLLKQAAEEQQAFELMKEAGRRDFDTLIAQAAAELEQQEKTAALQKQAEAEQQYELAKQAELQGAYAFDELYKQAQYDAVVEQNQQLTEKLAAYEAYVAQQQQKQAAAIEEQKFHKMANLVFEKLKNELSKQPVEAVR